MISGKLINLFDYHEYVISKDNLIKLSNAFIEIDPKLNVETFNKFIKEVELGKYGILYKMPTCILSMFQKFTAKQRLMMP